MRKQRGQAMLLAVLCLGMIMATIVMFGNARSSDASKTATKIDDSQIAYEALAAAGKKVQSIYANESACDPTSFNTRLSAMPALPPTAGMLGILANTARGVASVSYALAQPGLTIPLYTQADRENRCTGVSPSYNGCRQIAVPIDNYIYIVTVGKVSSDPAAVGRTTGDCARDASVQLSITVNRNLYTQRMTLTNLCTLVSCGNAGANTGFDTPGTIALTSALRTLACTGVNANIPVRYYGGGITESTLNFLSIDDIRWARRYLETGGEDSGDTNFLYTNGAITAGNGSCSPATSGSPAQCSAKNCIPALDVNRDGKNNEEDLAILENFMRGYLTSLPVNELQ